MNYIPFDFTDSPAVEAQLKFLVSLLKGTPPSPRFLASRICTRALLLDQCVRSTGAQTVTFSRLVGNMVGRCGALRAGVLLGGLARNVLWMRTGE